jgi:hypothetical protein
MANKEVAFKIVVDTSEVGEGVEKSIKSVEELGDATKKTSDQMKSGFKAAEQGTKGLGGSIVSVIKGLGKIGAVLAVFQFMKDIIMKNQKVADALGVAFKTIEILMNELFKAIESVGKILKSAFENPQQAIKDLISGWFNRFITSLKGIGVVAEGVGIQIKGALTLDFDEVKRGLQQYAQGLAQVATGMDIETQNKFIDGIKNVGSAAIDTASKIQSLTKDVKLAEAQQRLLMLQYQREAEIQRQIRDDVSLTIAQRQEANVKLGLILDKQSEEELGLFNKKKELAELELSINKDSIDNQVAVINAETEIADVRERITGQRSEQLVNTNSLIRENTELIKAQQAAIEAEALAEADAAYAIAEAKIAAENLLEAYLSERESLSREEMIQKEIDDAIAIEAVKRQAANVAASAHMADIETFAEIEQAFLDESFRIENEIRAKWGEEQIKLEQDIADKTEAIRQGDIKKQKDAAAISLGAAQKETAAKIKLAFDLANGISSIVSGLAGQSKAAVAIQKTIAIAQIAVDTAQSISSAIAGATASAAATGVGAVVATPVFIATQIATVLSAVGQAIGVLNSANVGGGSASLPNINVSAASAAPPSFNPVTTNTTDLGNTNQAELAPIQAFVVETQVTGSQNNINQIEGQATFGNPG